MVPEDNQADDELDLSEAWFDDPEDEEDFEDDLFLDDEEDDEC